MEIKRSGSHYSSIGPADWFTGTVHMDTRSVAIAAAAMLLIAALFARESFATR
jgi:hypothetical protein